MVDISVDDQTASVLQQQADAAGVSVSEYVRTLVAYRLPSKLASWEEVKVRLAQLAKPGNGPPLPDDFSRADIYIDHD